jgi:hypothetical protein
MIFRAFVFPVLALVAIQPAAAQQASLSGPLSGFLFDSPTSSIRPVVGIAGSAYLGTSVLGGVDFASVGPNGASALVIQGGQLSAVSGLNNPAPRITPLDAPFSSSMIIGWAQDGSRVVFASDSGGAVIQSIRWTGGVPSLDPAIDLSSIGGTISTLAVDAALQSILIGIRDQAAGGVYLWDRSGSPTMLAAMADPSALALSSDGAMAVATDRHSGLVMQFAVGVVPSPQPLLQNPDALSEPVGVVLSNDGKTVYIADRGKGVLACDVDSQVCSAIATDIVPKGFMLLAQSTVFLVSDRQTLTDPVVVFDSGSASIYFVPGGSAQ